VWWRLLRLWWRGRRLWRFDIVNSPLHEVARLLANAGLYNPVGGITLLVEAVVRVVKLRLDVPLKFEACALERIEALSNKM